MEISAMDLFLIRAAIPVIIQFNLTKFNLQTLIIPSSKHLTPTKVVIIKQIIFKENFQSKPQQMIIDHLILILLVHIHQLILVIHIGQNTLKLLQLVRVDLFHPSIKIKLILIIVPIKIQIKIMVLT